VNASPFVGWPLAAPDAAGHLDYAQDATSLREALWNVLMTNPGERLMRPSFGAGLGRWVAQPNTQTTRHLIAATITAAIAQWEQRVTVTAVDVEPDPHNAALVQITVSYTARGLPYALPDQLSLTLTLGGA